MRWKKSIDDWPGPAKPASSLAPPRRGELPLGRLPPRRVVAIPRSAAPIRRPVPPAQPLAPGLPGRGLEGGPVEVSLLREIEFPASVAGVRLHAGAIDAAVTHLGEEHPAAGLATEQPEALNPGLPCRQDVEAARIPPGRDREVEVHADQVESAPERHASGLVPGGGVEKRAREDGSDGADRGQPFRLVFERATELGADHEAGGPDRVGE